MKYLQGVILVTIMLSIFNINGCGKKEDLSKLSPKQIIDLYIKARLKGDSELLERIMYFPSETSDANKRAKVQLEIAGSEEKGIMRLVGMIIEADSEKIIDGETAEVKVVTRANNLRVILSGKLSHLGKKSPADEIILKKDKDIWKYHYNKYDLTKEQLIEMIRENPDNASAYYYLGMCYQAEYPIKASKFYKKYYELAPEGFWVTSDFKENLKEFEDTEGYESKMLAELYNVPKKSPDRALTYRIIAQLYMENNNYKKAKDYLNKAEDVLKLASDPLETESLNEAKKELRLRMEGKYHDILDEIEALEKKQSTQEK